MDTTEAMTRRQVADKAIQAEAAILLVIEEFEKHTGRHVDGLELSRLDLSTKEETVISRRPRLLYLDS